MTRRIAVAIIGTVVVTLLLSGTATFAAARISDRRQAEHDAREQAEGVVALMPDLERAANSRRTNDTPSTTEVPGNTGNRRPLIERLQGAIALSGVAELRIDANGVLQGQIPEPLGAADIPIETLRSGGSASGHSGNRVWGIAGRKLNDGTTLVIVTTAAQPALLAPAARWFLLCSLIAVLIGTLVAIGLARRLGRPVHAAVETTRRIADGELDARLPSPPPGETDELAVLARSINAMGDNLARSREQERHFLMSVSHDLRTPLTSIRGFAEAINDGAAADPGAAAAVILAESQRLERLVTDLLSLARLDADAFRFDNTRIDLDPVIRNAAESISHEMARQDLAVAVDSVPGVAVLADRDRLGQIVGNLLTNASGYARTTVWLRVAVEGADAVITVADDGPGIPADAVAHVFDRLYQADNQLDRRRPGSGLGLAIVSELTAAMGGTVTVRSQEGVGTTFSVRFPLTH